MSTEGSISLPVSTPGGAESLTLLDQLTKTVTSLVETTTTLAVAVNGQATAMAKSADAMNAKTAATAAAKREAAALAEVTKVAAATLEAESDSTNKLVAKLNEMIAAHGKGTLGVIAYRSALAETTDQTAPLIAELERLNRQTLELQATQQRDLALNAERAKSEAEYVAMLEAEAAGVQRAAEERLRITQSRDIELNNMRGKELAGYIAFWEETLAVQEAALAKELAASIAAEEELISAQHALGIQRFRSINENKLAAIAAEEEAVAAQLEADAVLLSASNALNAQRIRMTRENEQEALALEQSTAAEAVKIAERKAIAQIEWARLSADTQIKQLEKLRAYITAGVSEDTISKVFSSAAISSLNGTGEALENVGRAGANAGAGMSRATSEGVVMIREISRGNFTRLAGSFSIFAQAVGATINPLTILAATAVAFAVGVAKGSLEQDKFNNALIETGNYAGLTGASLDKLAHSAAGTEGSLRQAKESVLKLAESGKFTAEQIGTISEAAVLMERATGKSIDSTIKQFESLTTEIVTNSVRGSEALSRATLKLNDEYHFLTMTVFDHILELEKEGRQKEASKVATDALAEATKLRAEQMISNLGFVALAWNGITNAINGAIDSVGNFGKKTTAQSEVDRLNKQITDLDNGGGTTPGVYNEASRQAMLKKDKAELAIAQAALNKENTIAAGVGKEQLSLDEALHAKAQVAQMDAEGKRHSIGRLADEQARYHEQLTKMRGAPATEEIDPALTDSAIKKHEALLVTLYGEKDKKGPKGSDPARSVLAEALGVDSTSYKILEMQINAARKIATDFDRAGIIDEEQKQAIFKALNEQAMVARVEEYDKQITALEVYSRTARGINDAQISKMRQDLENKKQLSVEARDLGISVDNAKSIMDVAIANAKVAKEEDTQYTRQESAMTKKIDQLKLYNSEIGKSKADKEEAKLQFDIAQNQQSVEYELKAKNKLLEKDLTEVERDHYQRLYDHLVLINDQHKEYQNGLKQTKVLEQQAANDKLWENFYGKLGNDLDNAIFSGGTNGFKKLIKDMEVGFAKIVFKTVLGIDGQSITQALTGGTGGGGILSGASSLSSIGSSLSNVGSTVGGIFGASSALGGGSVASIASGSAYGTGFLSSQSLLLASQEATGTAASLLSGASSAVSSLSAGLAAIPVWGWAALAGVAAYAIFSGGGEKRSGGAYSYTPGGGVVKDQGPSGGDIALGQVQTSIKGTSDGLQTMLQAFGSTATVTGFTAGLETSKKGNAFAFAGGSLNGQSFGNSRANVEHLGNMDEGQAVAAFTLDLKRATLEGLQAANLGGFVSTYLSKLGDISKIKGDVADAALADIAQMEGLVVALKKLPFDNLRTASLDAVMGIASLTGGIGALSSKLGSYYSNYYTQAEQDAKALGNVKTALSEVGLVLPTTRDGFRALVDAQNVATPAGQKAYAVLLNNADAFANVVKAVTAANAVVTDYVKLTSDARTALSAVYGTESAAIQQTITDTKTYIATLKTFRDSLVLGASSPLTPQEKYQEAISQYNDTSAKAKSGDAAAQKDLTNMANAFLAASKTANASDAGYTADFNRVLADTAAVQDAASTQIDVAQLQLDALNKSVYGLIDIKKSVDTVAAAIDRLNFNQAQAIKTGTPASTFLNAGLSPGGGSGYLLQADAAPLPSQAAAVVQTNAPLVAVVNNLTAQVAGLRADQQQQTADMLLSADINAAANQATMQTISQESAQNGYWIEAQYGNLAP
jgi:hypothetical protein